MKTYQEQNYPVSVKVRVHRQFHWADRNGYYYSFVDHIKGLNPGHALYLAGLNWEGADRIERI